MKDEVKEAREEKIQKTQGKGFSQLAEAIYGVWQDRIHCILALELFNHVVDNNFDIFTPFSDPVPLNHNLVRTPEFRCRCGCNVFYEKRDAWDNHLILHCTNCDYPNWF